MASLDFVRDLLAKIKSQDIDYLLVSIQRGKPKYIGDVFTNLKDELSVTVALEIVRKIDKDLTKALKEAKKKEDQTEGGSE